MFFITNLNDSRLNQWLTNGQDEGMNPDGAFDLMELVTNLADCNGNLSVNDGVLWLPNGKSVDLKALLMKCNLPD